MTTLRFHEQCKMGPKEGSIQIQVLKGERPTLYKGNVMYDPYKTQLVSVTVDQNKIMTEGRRAFAQMMAGAIEGSRIASLELGVGAYGELATASTTVDPPEVNADDLDLIVSMSPRLVVPIDPVDGVVTPINNPLAKTFVVIVSSFPAGAFDAAQYIGISEFMLRFEDTEVGGVVTPGVPIAKRHKRPIVPDSETSIVVRWTLQF